MASAPCAPMNSAGPFANQLSAIVVSIAVLCQALMAKEERRKKKAAQRDTPNQSKKESLSDRKSNVGRKVPGKHSKKTEIGREVVRRVCAQLANAHIFPTLDPFLLEKVAQYESDFGKDEAYVTGSAPVGGIWRVTRTGFEDTRDLYAHPELEEYFIRMFKAFRINWSKVDWKRDMDIPLYSGLAAGLLIVICTPGLFPRRSGDKYNIEQEDILQGLYYSSARKNYDGVCVVKARKAQAITPGMTCQGTKKKPSKKTSSQTCASKPDLPMATRSKNSLSKARITESSKISRKSNPRPGQQVRGTVDFFSDDFHGAVSLRGRQKDRDRRWNSGVGKQDVHTHAISGKSDKRGGQRGGTDTRNRAQHGTTHHRQQRSSGAPSRPVRPAAVSGNQGVLQGGASARLQQGVLGQKPRPVRGAAQSRPEGRGGPVSNRQHGVRNIQHEEKSTATAEGQPSHPILEAEKLTEVDLLHKRQQGHGSVSQHVHFTSDKEGIDLEDFLFESDSDLTHSISYSDLCGLSALEETSHDEEANHRLDESGVEGVSSDRSDERGNEEDGSGSGKGQDHSDDIYDSVASDDDIYDSVASDGSSDDGSEDVDDSAELSNGDESDISDGSHSDDSFDDSDEDEDEEDPEHVYDDPSSDDDSEYTDDASGMTELESEEHIYEDPGNLSNDHDHVYEDPVDLLMDLMEPIYEAPDDFLHG